MSICSLASEAVSKISSSGSAGASLLGNIMNVVGTLGAADIGIQLGTGGQAGLGDLPGMFNQAGIECTDPDTGEVILVSPVQWYSNGMSCAGLRNPDQDRLEREQEDFDQRMRNREAIRNLPIPIPPSLINPLPPQMQTEIIRELQNIGTPSGGGGILFDFDGTLKQYTLAQTITSRDSYGSLGGNYRFHYEYSPTTHPWNFPSYSVSRGQSLSVRMPPDSNWSTGGFGGSASQFAMLFFLGASTRALLAAGITIRSQTINTYEPWTNNLISTTSTFSSTINDTSFSFEPSGGGGTGTGGGGTSNPGIIPSIIPPRNPDPRSPCNDGRRRRQPMSCSQCKLTPELIRKINELHKATGADKLATGSYRYAPEKDIRSYGRQLYRNPNNTNGTVKPVNLIDVIASTIAAEYHRLGLQRLPAELPKSLIPQANRLAEAIDRDTIKVDNTLSFHEQIFKLQDEVLGQWPIQFKVTDDNKTKEVNLWNLSEAIAELYGMQTKVVEDADLSVHWGVRAATEASKSGNAALKALHLLQELVKFTGAITTPGSLTVTSTFTPDPIAKQSNEDMLKPSVQTLVVTNIVDGSSLLELLKTISYAAQISAKAVIQPIKPNPTTGQPSMPGDYIKTQRKKRRADDKAFEKWKQEREKPPTNIPAEQRPPGYRVPDIKVVPQPDEKK